MEKQINFTIGFLLRNEQHAITIPMVREDHTEQGNAFAILTFNGALKKAKLKARDS